MDDFLRQLCRVRTASFIRLDPLLWNGLRWTSRHDLGMVDSHDRHSIGRFIDGGALFVDADVRRVILRCRRAGSSWMGPAGSLDYWVVKLDLSSHRCPFGELWYGFYDTSLRRNPESGLHPNKLPNFPPDLFHYDNTQLHGVVPNQMDRSRQ